MKQLTHKLLVVFITLLTTQLYVSCSKEKLIQQDPIVVTPVKKAAEITLKATLGTVFFNESDTINWSSNQLVKSGEDKQATSSGVIITKPITADNTVVEFTFTNEDGLMSKPTVVIKLHPDVLQRLSWNETTHKIGEWEMTRFWNDTDGTSAGPLDKNRWSYLPNGIRKYIIYDPNYPASIGTTFNSGYQLRNDNKEINLAVIGTENPYKIETLTKTTLTISKSFPDGALIKRSYTKK